MGLCWGCTHTLTPQPMAGLRAHARTHGRALTHARMPHVGGVWGKEGRAVLAACACCVLWGG
jgi:hypothetical protein